MTHSLANMPDLRPDFFLDPDIAFLNHGSFGACPRSVLEQYQSWQVELEREPVFFQSQRQDKLLAQARDALGQYIGCPSENLVFVTNATMGINIVAQSLDLKPGDEILSTDLEYGAIDYTWSEVCERANATYIRQPVPLPCDDPQQIVEAIWAGVTPKTRSLTFSHITSGTAIILPIAELVHRARSAGILTIVDGAHAPGQIDLDLTSLGADFYVGNCHKWMMAPKGSGFLYARREVQELLRPLIVSWGWRASEQERTGFIREQQMQGTRDVSAFLAVPAAINYMREHQWPNVRQACHGLLNQTRQQIAKITGLTPLTPDSWDWYAQMATVPLPPCDTTTLKEQLYREYRIQVPVTTWRERPFVRVSIQGYNSQQDMDRLVEAIHSEFT